MSKPVVIRERTKKVKDFISTLDLDVVGIASADDELFLEAPPEYQPKNILEGANSVIDIDVYNKRFI